MNYTHYCLDQNNRLYFADRNYIGYSDNYQTELKKVKYDTTGDNLYYFGHYNNKLYMVKKYALYEIDPITLNLTKLAHNTTFFDWYNTSYGILSNLLYYTTRYNAETSYHVLNLDTKQIVNISVATYNLLTHADSVPAVSFKGINKFASVYDSANRLYTPTIERYELNSKCELEKASVITAPFTVSRITKAFIYDDNHIGIYANGLISIYNMHTGVKLHEITSTVQSSYVIYGLCSSSQDFITLIKESSSSIKLYSNTKLLKSHTSFTDFKRQNQVVTYMAYRADNAIQVVKVGIQKQSGMIALNLGERIYAHNKGLLPTKENTYGEASDIWDTQERVVIQENHTISLKERIVETIHTKDLALTEEIIRPNYERLSLKESIVGGGHERLKFTEGVPDLGKHLETLTGRVTNGSEALLLLKETTEQHYSNHHLLLNQEIVRLERQGQNIIYLTADKKLYISTDNGITVKEVLANSLDTISREKFACNETYFFFYSFYSDRIMVYDQEMILRKSIQDPPSMSHTFKALKDVLVFDDTLLNLRNDKRYYIGSNITEHAKDFRINRQQTEITYTVFSDFRQSTGWTTFTHLLYSFEIATGKNRVIDRVEYEFDNTKFPNIYHAAFGVVAIFDQVIKFYDLKTNKLLFEIDDRSKNPSFSFFALDNEKDIVTIIDRRDAATGLHNYRLYQNDKLYYDSEATAENVYPPLCAIDAYNPIFVSTWSACNHKLVTHFVGNPIFEADRYLGLKEQIVSCENLRIRESVQEAKNVLFLSERSIEFATETLLLKEHILTGVASLELEENILAYTHSSAALVLKEKITPPHQDFDDLALYERSCFKPGEWGTGKKNLWLKEKVVPVPYHSIWLKGEVINKPIATHALDLSLAENVWAYHTYLTQKEALVSDKVYWYYRDGILGEPVMIPEAKTAYITTEWSISQHDYVVFEIDSHNPIIESVRFDSLDGLTFETIRNIKCDSYTLIDAYTGAKRQVYGFIAKAPFHCSHLRINNKGKSFKLLRLYDGYNPSMMGEHYLGLTEHIESQATTLPMGERVWLESDGERRSIYLTERIFPTAPEVLDLTLKEQIQGLDGEAVAKTKERVILPDTDTHSDLYYMEAEDRPKLQVHPVWNMPHIIKKSGCLLVKFERAKTDWEQNIYLKLSSTHGLRTFSVVIGFYDEKTNELAGIRDIGYIDSYTNQYEAHVDVTRYIHNAIGQANLVTDKIAYIGIRGFFYDEQMSINSMEVVRIRGSITRDIFTKEFVMTSVRDSYTPELLRYRDNNGHDTYYTYNQVIKFVRDYNDRYITNVVAEMAKPVVPEHISIVASQPIGDLILYYKQKTMIKPAKVELIDNKYYHDFDLAGSENVTDWMIMKFAGPEAEVVVYSINMYHNGFRDYKTLALQERIFPAPEKMVLSLREKVEYAPGITLTLKETADKLCVSARALGTKEYITTPEHTIAAALLNIKETAKPYTYSRGIWLNELVPSEPQENVLAVYEHILANTTQDLALTEDIVYYKANSDGKIMIERVPH